MDEVDHYHNEETAALGQAALAILKAILSHHCAENLRQLSRNLYKYTTCGAWLAVTTHDDREVYGDYVDDVPLGNVRSLIVGSIVEGVDYGTEQQEFDLIEAAEKFETNDEAVADFSKLIDWVESEAKFIWDGTHGCETCGKHWAGDPADWSEDDWKVGETFVWRDCPDCNGCGTVI